MYKQKANNALCLYIQLTICCTVDFRMMNSVAGIKQKPTWKLCINHSWGFSPLPMPFNISFNYEWKK